MFGMLLNYLIVLSVCDSAGGPAVAGNRPEPTCGQRVLGRDHPRSQGDVGLQALVVEVGRHEDAPVRR